MYSVDQKGIMHCILKDGKVMFKFYTKEFAERYCLYLNKEERKAENGKTVAE